MRRPPRRLVVAAVALVFVVAAGRLALAPVAAWRTRRALAALQGMHGTFAEVEVDVLGLSYAIRGLRIEKVTAGGGRLPMLEVERATFVLRGRELLRGRLVGSVDLDGPTLHVVQAPKPKPAPPPGEPQQVEEAPKEGRGLARVAPFRVDRAQARRGQILLVRASALKSPILRLHGIELVLDDLAAGSAAGGRPTVLTGRGLLQRSGRISAFATADPGATRATFAGEAKLTGLRFVELGEIVADRSGIEPDSGVLDMVVRFAAVDGRISGEVRPILRGAGTRPASGGIAAHVKSMLADSSLDVFRSDVAGGGNPQVTTVPIAGTVKDPRARPVPIIIGILRNAFVAGLTAALSGPPSAETRERARAEARRGAPAPKPRK